MKRVAKRRRRKRKVKLERRRKKRGKLRMILLETKITTPLRTNKVWLLSQFSSFSFLFAKMTRKLLKGAKETNTRNLVYKGFLKISSTRNPKITLVHFDLDGF